MAALTFGARPKPGPGRVDPELLWGILSAGALAAVRLIPFPTRLGLSCPFKTLSGLPCPTCGMSRAWEALAHGEWAAACRLHPGVAAGYAALWLYVPYAAGAVAGLWPRLDIRPSPGAARGFRMTVLALLAALWGYLIWDGR